MLLRHALIQWNTTQKLWQNFQRYFIHTYRYQRLNSHIKCCSMLQTPLEAMTMWEACTGAGCWQDLWTHRERSPCWNRFASRTWSPVGDPWWSSLFLKNYTLWKELKQFVRDCSSWAEFTLEKFVKECFPWEGPHAEVEEECEKSWTRGGKSSGANMNNWPYSYAAAEVGDRIQKWSSGRRGGRCFKI